MATEGLVFSPKSIMDLNVDTIYESSGTATLNSGSLVLGANSTASFRYTYNTTDNILESEQLQFILNVVNSNTWVNSRYDESVQVECYIQYWKETVDESGNTSGYVLGSTDNYQLMPYFRHENEGYINIYDINITKLKAVSIVIKFINESDASKYFMATVCNLTYYNTIDEMFNDYNIEILADKSMTKEELRQVLMEFYTIEKQNKYGMVAILIKLD